MSRRSRAGAWLPCGVGDSDFGLVSAPLSWLRDYQARLITGMFATFGLSYTWQATGLWAEGGDYESAVASVLSIGWAFAGMAFAYYPWRHPATFEIGTMLVWGLCYLSQTVMAVTHSDVIFRMRALAQSSLVCKGVPVVFGYPFRYNVVFGVFGLMIDNGAMHYAQHYEEDPITWMQYSTLVMLALAYIPVSCIVQLLLRHLYSAEIALASEKAAMEALLAMMCDSCIWLDGDRDTVLKCDSHFEMLVGRQMAGQSWCSCIHREDEEELSRITSVFKRAKERPQLLPLTLVSNPGGRTTVVDAFIVGRTIGGEGPRTTYFVGIRTAGVGQCPCPDAAPPAALREFEHPGVRRREDELASTVCSFPETTATSRVFTDLDHCRGLAGAGVEAKRELELLKPRLERVERLGAQEGWLVKSADLHLLPDQILGSGSFGVVAAAAFHGTAVAVKVPRLVKDMAQAKHIVSMANELRILRHIRHPCIVLFHGACVEPATGEICLVLEHVEGTELGAFVTEHCDRHFLGVRYRLLLDVACALRFLHAQWPCVVHGDLKPSNVLVEAARPRAKLLDFGLARVLTRGVQPLGGTMRWMAPEIIRDPAQKPQPGADVFSFGRMAFTLVTGRKPLDGAKRHEIIDAVKLGRVLPMQWPEAGPLVAECQSLCGEIMAFEPARRPQMQEVHETVLAWDVPGVEGRLLASPQAGLEGLKSVRQAVGGQMQRP